MYIRMHCPSDREDLADLHKKISAVHAGAVYRYLCRLPCSKEQKRALLQSLRHAHRIRKEKT